MYDSATDSESDSAPAQFSADYAAAAPPAATPAPAPAAAAPAAGGGSPDAMHDALGHYAEQGDSYLKTAMDFINPVHAVESALGIPTDSKGLEKMADGAIDKVEDGAGDLQKKIDAVTGGIPIPMIGDLGTTTQFVGGVAKGVVGMAAGLGNMAEHPLETVVNLNSLAEHIPAIGTPSAVVHGLINSAMTGENPIDAVGKQIDPMNAVNDAKRMGEGILAPMEKSWGEGRYADAVGQGVAQIGAFFVGGEAAEVGELGDAAEGVKATEALAEGSEGTKALSTAADESGAMSKAADTQPMSRVPDTEPMSQVPDTQPMSEPPATEPPSSGPTTEREPPTQRSAPDLETPKPEKAPNVEVVDPKEAPDTLRSPTRPTSPKPEAEPMSSAPDTEPMSQPPEMEPAPDTVPDTERDPATQRTAPDVETPEPQKAPDVDVADPDKAPRTARSKFDTEYRPKPGERVQWPPNNGAEGEALPVELGGDKSALPAAADGKVYVDRYGSDYGDYLSPHDTPYDQRGILDGPTYPHPDGGAMMVEGPQQYSKFEVMKPMPADQSTIGRAFGAGGGTQFKAGMKVKDLIDQGYLRRTPPVQ